MWSHTKKIFWDAGNTLVPAVPLFSPELEGCVCSIVIFSWPCCKPYCLHVRTCAALTAWTVWAVNHLPTYLCSRQFSLDGNDYTVLSCHILFRQYELSAAKLKHSSASRSFSVLCATFASSPVTTCHKSSNAWSSRFSNSPSTISHLSPRKGIEASFLHSSLMHKENVSFCMLED